MFGAESKRQHGRSSSAACYTAQPEPSATRFNYGRRAESCVHVAWRLPMPHTTTVLKSVDVRAAYEMCKGPDDISSVSMKMMLGY